MCYNEEESVKLCQQIQKALIDRELINISQRDTIIAAKLSTPVTINDLVQVGHTGVVREEEFFDPLLAGEKVRADGNFNKNEDRAKWKARKDAKHAEKEKAEKDALDKKIEQFMATKKKVPPPRVIHDKSESSKADIYLPDVTLVAGGKALLDKATVRLARGRKYGLIGRNGIGKTTLINAMCRREIEKMPQNLHVLQVEQEVAGDDIPVLKHVLDCDVERLELLKQQQELPLIDTSEMEPEEKQEIANKLSAVNERLELIDAANAETKAIHILTGLGFKQHEL